uniref:Uncharacterized protein n=1 Tax=Bos indicus x Bos taurus TaxID=30522 RepID=A0A4W2IIL6_BOBOX
MDRRTCQATVHGSQRVRHHWELSMYTMPAMKREHQVEVTGLCREVRQTKQEVNWQIKGANTKWRQQNNCLLLLTCGLSFYPSERFDPGLALTGSVVRLCEAAARTGLQRAEIQVVLAKGTSLPQFPERPGFIRVSQCQVKLAVESAGHNRSKVFIYCFVKPW